MTATISTAGSRIDDQETAEFRLSARQCEMLTLLNDLFDEVCVPTARSRECFDDSARPEFSSDVSVVSRI